MEREGLRRIVVTILLAAGVFLAVDLAFSTGLAGVPGGVVVIKTVIFALAFGGVLIAGLLLGGDRD